MNILLVSLWLAKEKLSEEIRKRVAHVHVVYSADAVNHIIKILYENYTYVDTVVIYGPDFRNIGDLIINALRGNCNEVIRIPCKYVKDLNVSIVDMRWRSERELREMLEKLYRERDSPARPNVYIELEIPNRRYPQRGPHVIYDTDLEALRIKAIDYLLTYGVETQDVIYGIVILQREPMGSYTASICDLLRDWPCGLDRHAVLLTTPAYIRKSDEPPDQPEIYRRDVYDPRGNFYLGDKLYHYSHTGVLLRAVEITDIQMKREASKLLPDHAFYLGQEYAAYKLLRERYVQDKWEFYKC